MIVLEKEEERFLLSMFEINSQTLEIFFFNTLHIRLISA